MNTELIKDKHGSVIQAGDVVRITVPVPDIPLSHGGWLGDNADRLVRVELDVKTGNLTVDGSSLYDIYKDPEYTLEVYTAADKAADDPLLFKF